jgi:predicted acetyltransferase
VTVILRPFGSADETPARAAWEESRGPGFDFLLLDYDPRMPCAAWTALMERCRQGVDLPENRVRGAFLAAEADGQLVGSAWIRFDLNAFFAARGGHVGYGVFPAFRQRG